MKSIEYYKKHICMPITIFAILDDLTSVSVNTFNMLNVICLDTNVYCDCPIP